MDEFVGGLIGNDRQVPTDSGQSHRPIVNGRFRHTGHPAANPDRQDVVLSDRWHLDRKRPAITS